MSHYVKNSELILEIVECKKNGELSPKAIEMFWKIANEAVKKLKYKNPMDREDCISSAMEDLLRYWKGYDPAKGSNAFAYFSQISKNGYCKIFRKLHPEGAGNMVSISHDGGIYNI